MGLDLLDHERPGAARHRDRRRSRLRARLRRRLLFHARRGLRFGVNRSRALNGLGTNAYSLYLVHYDFVVWLQYALLGSTLFAVIKGALVFAGTLVLSLITLVVVQHVPFAGRLFGMTPGAVDETRRGYARRIFARIRQFVSQ